jgi:hypothetical protein
VILALLGNFAVPFLLLLLLAFICSPFIELRPHSAHVFRPVEMTLVKDLANSFEEVALTLRHCDHLCTLLAYQSTTIKNTYYLRCALIQHVFTRTIPLPLPANHPERMEKCFWSQPLRYESQLDIMRLIDLNCKHFSACALSMPLTRDFDTARVLTLSCMAVMSDALIRIIACDVPSQFCLHFSGQHDSACFPKQAFGFDIGISFAMQSENMLFTDASLCALRSQVLDYFHQQKADVKPDYILFEWESTMQCGPALERLFEQLCHEVGFPHEELPQYLTGQMPEILSNFPEFKYYRDIVFAYKFMLSPTHEAFPKLRPWFQKEANLVWSYEAKEGYAIQGFSQILKCDFETEADKKKGGISGFFRNMFGGDSSRAPTSGANPSLLVGEKINNEDDVLYIRPLPTFDNRLSQRDVELLLSYLTVPYIRVPLVLRFFAVPERVTALGCPKLRQVLDDVLFEPGAWQSSDNNAPPATIPGTSRDHLRTPCGLLLNELVHSPHGVLQPLQTLLEAAKDLDTGKYSLSTSPTILYVLRLFVRVEGYIKFLIKHVRWTQEKDRRTSSGPETFIRGLICDNQHLDELVRIQSSIRLSLDQELFPMLDSWNRVALRKGQNKQVCILNAHFAFLYKHVDLEDFNVAGQARVVSTLLSSLLTLTARHDFEKDLRGKREKNTTEVGEDHELQLSNNEIFDCMQQQRCSIFRWLLKYSKEANDVFEAVVRIATSTGTRSKRFDGAKLSVRNWTSTPGRACLGRFVPGMETGSSDVADTEINLQLGDFTLKTHRMELLSHHFAPEVYSSDALVDFSAVFALISENEMQCAVVKHTTNRDWVRLVGRRHDIQFWSLDTRHALLDSSRFTRQYPDCISGSERWVGNILEPVRRACLRNVTLHMGPAPVDEMPYVLLSGVHTSERRVQCVDMDGKLSQRTETTSTLKELVVFKHGVVQVYNIVEHGRRLYRSQVYSSDSRLSLAALSTAMPDKMLAKWAVGQKYACGRAGEAYELERNLVISRNLTSKSDETYLPARLLRGVLPDALSDLYTCWQQNNGHIMGYLSPAAALLSDAPTTLTITVSAEGQAFVVRRLIEATDSSEDVELLDGLFAPAGSEINSLVNLCIRLDDLSHVLIWAKSGAKRVHRIELPRLRINFTSRRESGHDGQEIVRLYCDEHVGFFLSQGRSQELEPLLHGLPNSVLFENINGELIVLLPASLPKRPAIVAEPLSTELIFLRGDQEWLSNIEVRHYVYPVHLSRTFLFSETLASSLYLLLMRFLARDYAAAFKLCHLCVSDVALSAEEEQLFRAICDVEDAHPDANAVRCKISIVTQNNEMRPSWNSRDVTDRYVKMHRFVSLACRLTVDEELSLLKPNGTLMNQRTLVNRGQYLQVWQQGGGIFQASLPPVPATTHAFDTCVDKSMFEVIGDIESVFLKLSYSQPSPVSGSLAIKTMNQWLIDGMRLKGGPMSLGFLFLFELMTNVVKITVLPGDSPFELGALLLRMLPAKDYTRKSQIASLLRLMASHRHLVQSKNFPLFKDDRKFKLTIMFGKQHAVSNLFKECKTFFQGNLAMLKYPTGTSPTLSTVTTISVATGSWSRDLLCAHHEDFSCASRILSPIADADCALTNADLEDMCSQPLKLMGLKGFFVAQSRKEQKLAALSTHMPFDISGHKHSGSHHAKATIARLHEDSKVYADQQNSQLTWKCVMLLDGDVEEAVKNPTGSQAAKALQQVKKLLATLNGLQKVDSAMSARCIILATERANKVETQGDTHRLGFVLDRYARRECLLSFEFLVCSLISSKGDESIQQLNPYLSSTDVARILDLTVTAMLLINRVAHVNLCLASARELLAMLMKLQRKAKNGPSLPELVLQAGSLASQLTAERHYVGKDGKYDPRFLVFEFTHSILLRKSQCALVDKFMAAAGEPNGAICHQMIMGAGKTTVVHTRTHAHTHTHIHTHTHTKTHTHTHTHAHTHTHTHTITKTYIYTHTHTHT